MASSEAHRQAAEEALSHARRNPVMSTEQWFRAAQVHALLAIEARLEQIVGLHSDRPDLIGLR
jgi:hypothetical protein